MHKRMEALTTQLHSGEITDQGVRFFIGHLGGHLSRCLLHIELFAPRRQIEYLIKGIPRRIQWDNRSKDAPRAPDPPWSRPCVQRRAELATADDTEDNEQTVGSTHHDERAQQWSRSGRR